MNNRWVKVFSEGQGRSWGGSRMVGSKCTLTMLSKDGQALTHMDIQEGAGEGYGCSSDNLTEEAPHPELVGPT
ncbi:hypothetical protein Tco_0922365 [Tanacetum coccineum]|uniref:Uncharacterized protein n=1 Tax=Tanacetum coccineum TaxID=301880 RepID=A0ABQ5CY12_9ASTR